MCVLHNTHCSINTNTNTTTPFHHPVMYLLCLIVDWFMWHLELCLAEQLGEGGLIRQVHTVGGTRLSEACGCAAQRVDKSGKQTHCLKHKTGLLLMLTAGLPEA